MIEEEVILSIKKLTLPTLYLDSNIIIELAKHEKGLSTSEYKEQIRSLYEFIREANRKRQLLCPLGNQQEEISVSKAREGAKQF